MSQSDTTAENEFAQTTVEQDTILTIYGAEADEYESAREFVADVFCSDDTVDIFEQETNEDRHVELRVEFTGEVERSYITHEKTYSDSIRPFRNSEKEVFANSVDSEDLPDGFELIDETTVEEIYTYSTTKPIKKLAKNMVNSETIEARGFHESEYHVGSIGWNREIEDLSVDADPNSVIKQECYVSVGSSRSIEPKDVLRHKDDRSQHKTFEDGEQRWAAQITVHLEGEDSDEVTGMARGLIPKLQMELSALDNVYDVRLKSCEKETTEHGDCYQL